MAKIQEIPNKLYFRIGEVSELVGVRPYVLRYWESEFQDIKPTKSKSGQRLYKRRDVESLVKIKQLLYEERFTIDGARKRLRDVMRGDDVAKPIEQVIEAPVMPVVNVETKIDKPVKHEIKKIEESTGKVFIKLKKDLESVITMLKKAE